MPTHQIWPCHVTQLANFENVSFFSDSTFNIRKSHKISNGKAFYFRSYLPKLLPPVPLGLSKVFPTKQQNHMVHVTKAGVSGSEDRGGGDNSIQVINFGRVGDKILKNGDKK